MDRTISAGCYIYLVYAKNFGFPDLGLDKPRDFFCFGPETARIYKGYYRSKGEFGKPHCFYFFPYLPWKGNPCRLDNNNVRLELFFKGLKGILHADSECTADAAACKLLSYNVGACENIPIKSDFPYLIYNDCSPFSCVTESAC